jgi:hypothetical protein
VCAGAASPPNRIWSEGGVGSGAGGATSPSARIWSEVVFERVVGGAGGQCHPLLACRPREVLVVVPDHLRLTFGCEGGHGASRAVLVVVPMVPRSRLW